MTNKQALLRAAVKIGAEKWVHIGGGEVITEQYEVDGLLMADHICNCEVTGTSSPKAKFIAAANPATVLALLDELEAKDKLIAELEARAVTVAFKPLPLDELGSARDGKKYSPSFGAGYNCAVIHCDTELRQACANAGIRINGEG